MDDDGAPLITGLLDASLANQVFLVTVVDGLVRSGALPLPTVLDGLRNEQALIETLRHEGADPRLEAIALEALAGRLLRMLPWPRDVHRLLDEWRLDPRDPTWPQPPANDPQA